MSSHSSNYILGLHVTGVQSAAALFEGGECIAAVAEERLTRQKRSRAFPLRAIEFCLRSAGLRTLHDVAQIVVPWNPAIHMANLNMSGFTSWRRYDPEWLYIVPNNLMGLLPDAGQEMMELGFGDGSSRFTFLQHHLAHAGWAFASPFEEAAIAIVDEYGESSSMSFGKIAGNAVTMLRSTPFPHSLGVFYATLTAFLGFSPNGDEWKVMGAGAYGDPTRFAAAIRSIVKVDGGSLHLDQSYFEFANTRVGGYFGKRLEKLFGIVPRKSDEELTQAHFDLAASCQQVFEESLLTLLTWLHGETKSDNLVLNGGCAMNSLANGKIVGNTPFKQVFIGPAAADNGAAIGGALYSVGTAGGSGVLRGNVEAYLGPAYSDADVQRLLDRYKIRYRHISDISGVVAGMLIDGKIVGWHQGRMEFGERALGCRSILADPRKAGAKDRVNESIKYRESFRPFAPSVLAEDAGDWFDMPHGERVPFMEKVFPVRFGKREQVPAIVHGDGSGRLQTVECADNELFYRLISSFKRRTGVPMVLNTSFNLNGEPIVCSPEDALRTFVTSGLDALAIGSFIVEK